MNVLDLDSLDCDLLLADRSPHGAFKDLADFATRRKAPPYLRTRFAAANKLAAGLGGYQRP